MCNFWTGKKILVTGGAGFVGSHVVNNLTETRGILEKNIKVPRSKELDLRDINNARKAVKGVDIILHLAADVGGLGYSRTHPATQYYNCNILDLQIAEAAREEGVSKIVALSSTTAYPKNIPSPLREEELFGVAPLESHRGYGWAKRNLVSLAEVYHQQYDMDFIVIIANNAYGPGDNFAPKKSHVIPATIRKCFEEKELVVWGDGSPSRDFLYVEDLAEAIILAAEKLHGFEYFNVASGEEVSIGELINLISRLCSFKGPIRFDPTKPKGEPMRTVNVERAKKLIDFRPRFSLEDGLSKTIGWYIKERQK